MIPKVKIEINLKELYTKQSDSDNTILTCAELNDAIETIHNVNRHSERPKTGILTKQKIEKPRRCFFVLRHNPVRALQNLTKLFEGSLDDFHF